MTVNCRIHPEKPCYARGLCYNCYFKSLQKTFPQCINHPKRKAVVKRLALCGACYDSFLKNRSPVYQNQVRKYDRKRWVLRYGITPEDYTQMVKEQNGVCAICKKPESSGRNLAVDHDHNTGQIRGLLCSRCNIAFELFKKHTQGFLFYLKKNYEVLLEKKEAA